MSVSADEIMIDIENHALSEEAEKMKCVRRYFDDTGTIVEYNKLPEKYKLKSD